MHGAPKVTRNDRHARRQGSNVSRRARPWDQLIEVAREIEFTRLIRGVRAHALSLSNTLTPHSVSVWHRFHELAFSTDVSSVAVQPQQRNEFFRRRLVHIKSQSLSSLSRPTCFPLTTILREAFPGLPCVNVTGAPFAHPTFEKSFWNRIHPRWFQRSKLLYENHKNNGPTTTHVTRFTNHSRSRGTPKNKERARSTTHEKGRGGFHENSCRSFEASSSVRASHLAESESPGRPCNDAQVHAGQESLLTSPAPSGLSLSTFYHHHSHVQPGTATTTIGIGVATTGVPIHLFLRSRQTSLPLSPPSRPTRGQPLAPLRPSSSRTALLTFLLLSPPPTSRSSSWITRFLYFTPLAR